MRKRAQRRRRQRRAHLVARANAGVGELGQRASYECRKRPLVSFVHTVSAQSLDVEMRRAAWVRTSGRSGPGSGMFDGP